MEKGRQGRLKYTILRPTTVYGPRGGYGARSLFTAMMGTPVVSVPANFLGHLPFVHVEDVAGAGLYLAQSDKAENETYNLNDDTEMTTVDYMQTMARLLGKPFFKLPPVPIRQIVDAALPLLRAQLYLTRDLLKVKPLAEPQLVAYLPEDFHFSNRKLKDTGFVFKYPDARMAFPATLKWYVENPAVNGMK